MRYISCFEAYSNKVVVRDSENPAFNQDLTVQGFCSEYCLDCKFKEGKYVVGTYFNSMGEVSFTPQTLKDIEKIRGIEKQIRQDRARRKMLNKPYDFKVQIVSSDIVVLTSVGKSANQDFVIPKYITCLGSVFAGDLIESHDFGLLSRGDYNMLRELVVPEHIKYISYKAFSGFDNLERIEFKGSLKHIDRNIFYGCDLTSLQQVILPSEVESISLDAFTLSPEDSFSYLPIKPFTLVVPRELSDRHQEVFNNTELLNDLDIVFVDTY